MAKICRIISAAPEMAATKVSRAAAGEKCTRPTTSPKRGSRLWRQQEQQRSCHAVKRRERAREKSRGSVNYFAAAAAAAAAINCRAIKHKWKLYKRHQVFAHFHIVSIIAACSICHTAPTKIDLCAAIFRMCFFSSLTLSLSLSFIARHHCFV